MIKTMKVMLCPNHRQKTKLFACAGFARFSYNWAVDYEKKNYEEGNRFISDCDLRKVFTELKKKSEYAWFNNYSNNISKQAIKDAVKAYQNFFKGIAECPKFKRKRKSKASFYADPCKIQFTETHVKLEKLTTSRKANKQKFNSIKLAEGSRIPTDAKYFNPRITFDGLKWYISVGMEWEESAEPPTNQGIGIDIGIKDLAICSDEQKYQNINKAPKVKKLEKRKRRLQRSIARKYEKNKKGESYCKTKNLIKEEKELLKLYHRLTNLRQNHFHQTTTEIINRKLRFIVLEDLNVKGMMKNRHLSNAVQQQCFGAFRRQIEYKSAWNKIPVIIADRFFPSSKLCCRCGKIKKDLKLSDRIYRCECGNVIDRDYQAALNLKRYGEITFPSVS